MLKSKLVPAMATLASSLNAAVLQSPQTTFGERGREGQAAGEEGLVRCSECRKD